MFERGVQFKISCISQEVLTKKGVSLARSLVRCAGPKVMKTVLSTEADLMSGKDVKKP